MNERCDFPGPGDAVFSRQRRLGGGVRTPFGKAEMSLLYWLAGIIALILLVYLVFALLQPERFG
jgi:K+-transporting ATPase KdpF subunit